MTRKVLLSFCAILPFILHGQKVGLVLSGGGAMGLTHIGVIKALEENGIPIDYITGSSMGALVGAMYASGYSAEEMDSLFQTDQYQLMSRGGVEPDQVYHFQQDVPDPSLLTVRFALDTIIQASLPTNLRSPVLTDWSQMLGFSGASAISGGSMDSLFVPFRCVASDLTTQRQVVLSHGDLAQAVRASISYPFYFKPIKVEGHLMMDGGLYNNFPSDVMYEDFMPDYIIGSNVAFNGPPPSEDDLMSQLRAIMVEKTDYSVPCDPGLIILPRTATTLFDFTTSRQAVKDGYDAAMERMLEIKANIVRRVPPDEVRARRAAFRARLPHAVFGRIIVEGLKPNQTRYCERILDTERTPVSAEDLKSRYFRLYADQNVSDLFPRSTWVPERGDHDLNILVKREKRVEARFGGLISTRPVNTGMLGIRYKFFGHTSAFLDGAGWFGKFYTGGQLKLRMDLRTAAPFYLEPSITIHRWDWFRGFNDFFRETRPAYIVSRELWGGMSAGMGMGNKGLLRVDARYARTRDEYYQTQEFGNRDTADVTDFNFGSGGLVLERNSLNRKQHPNAGELLRVDIRYVSGDEHTIPGSTTADRAPSHKRHDWFTAQVTLDKYFFSRKKVRFGIMAEGVYSTQDFFQNYTASVLRSPVFQPTPESRTYFIDAFRAQQYLAGGARAIMAVARNRFDLRLEGYVFQPYKTIVRASGDAAVSGTAISDRYFIASGSLIWQSPIGPVWFNTSYLDGLPKPWAFSLNFGYIIFARKALG
ncbi:MAG TPA: patatin-like phospholipase family protein [Flavobacteriales bacterium]|nr:patatin-like phospholipase family protein [Flavobacteriales bacterium]HNE80780.1 patatin-like phospholipase family protein [Flavobacteriales bacterium]HNI04322.1 patatin-like phospholipase family protein [Flavobacteriales bacterium]HNK84931.1 patatin-like phospholipase family protein [Flavobacteriales bacterium]HNM69834.1 patatin-like phospholipase family protein [Flavobacteriales bacterium]